MPDFWLEDWWTKPANAADFLEVEIFRREDPDFGVVDDWASGVDDYHVVKVPLPIARVLLDCARRGVPRKRGRQPDSFLRNSRKETFALLARLYKDKLVRDRRMNATEAELEAAEKFAHLLYRVHRINIAPSTLGRLMQRFDADATAVWYCRSH